MNQYILPNLNKHLNSFKLRINSNVASSEFADLQVVCMISELSISPAEHLAVCSVALLVSIVVLNACKPSCLCKI